VVYLANFENEPDAVSALARGRTLWGNAPDVLRRVRDPLTLMKAFREHDLPAPAVRTNANAPNDRNAPNAPNVPNDPNDPNDSNDPSEWLVKPVASGGGRGIKPWKGNEVPPGFYLQERIEGVPGSVVFVSAGGSAVMLGISRQLIGDAAFGADGYRYCGNILASAGDPVFEQDETLVDRAYAIAAAATASFGLVGLNGVDFIAAAGAAHPIEVNPRWSGAMELVERAYGVSLFGMHANACARTALPDFDLRHARRGARAAGKAILFAREQVTVGDTRPWLADASVRDVPQPGEYITAGRPICTVFAEGDDARGCYEALVRRAEQLYASLTAALRWIDP
jgi:predicted ATP-grasp superfamily ATP-dependent carboligase